MYGFECRESTFILHLGRGVDTTWNQACICVRTRITSCQQEDHPSLQQTADVQVLGFRELFRIERIASNRIMYFFHVWSICLKTSDLETPLHMIFSANSGQDFM